jgi:8-oxo-dGTP diphosphatase
VRDGHTYFDFPGSAIREGESPADAAVREAQEELGVRVVLGPRLLIEEFRGQTVHYFSALVVGGEFGTGTGDEPFWMDVSELPYYDVRPRALTAILTGG